MADYIEQGDVKQVIVQHKDGSTWRAEIGLDGKVRLLEQLNKPESYEPQEDEDQQIEQEQEQDGQGEQDQADQSDSDSGEADAQPEAGDTDQWGDAEASETDEDYTDEEIERLIQGFSHRGSNSKTQDGLPPRQKLTPEQLRKLKDPAFQSRLSSVMLDNKYARRVRGRTRGKLDMGRLYKVPTQSRSVFMQKQERKGKVYNVILCLDQSGSMSGRKITIASDVVMFLAKQFENLNINLGVIGYADNPQVYKELNTKKINYDELYSKVNRTFGGTNDYPALRRAYHMFKSVPEGKNILIMLSDGSPGFYQDVEFLGVDGKEEHIRQLPDLLPQGTVFDYYGDDHGEGYINYNDAVHLHHLVNSHPDVTSIGIGIQQGGWQVPNHFVIHKVDDMKKAVISTLRQQITRG